VTVGVGAGGEFAKEFEAVGVPLAERGARTNEGIEVLRKLWSGGPVSYSGRFYSLSDVELRSVQMPGREASAMQPGGPRIVACGRKESAMRRAARLGQGWMPYLVSPNAYKQTVEVIQAEADAVGRDLVGFEWMMYLYCSVRRDGDRARADVAKFLGSAYGDKPQAMLDKIAPSGTPEQVAERMQDYVDAGVRHFIIAPAAQEDTLEVVTLAAQEVLPRLRIREPAPTQEGR
jgi:alkanesulfonate monooxygenase SsuD/methylene tetrahydromethanopterin reductase-like flavin-dependent oxidoreductase (luciferase family)